MPSPQDWGEGHQRDAEDPRYFVPEGTTSASRSRQPTPSSEDDDDEGNVNELFNENAWDDCDDIDLFDLLRVRLDEDEELLRAQPDNGLPSPLRLEKLLSEHTTDKFRQEILVRQSTTKDSKFFEDPRDGLLTRKPSQLPGKFQMGFPRRCGLGYLR